METVCVLCRPALCEGFALAGVRALAASDATEADAVLGHLAEQPDTAVVLIEETLYRQLTEERRRALERRPVPVVVPFPGPPGEEERPSAEAELAELLRSAIGYRVRLR